MHCPLCDTCDIGKVGTNQFYCWNCLLEFNEEEGEIRFYQVKADGTLLYIDLETASTQVQSSGVHGSEVQG